MEVMAERRLSSVQDHIEGEPHRLKTLTPAVPLSNSRQDYAESSSRSKDFSPDKNGVTLQSLTESGVDWRTPDKAVTSRQGDVERTSYDVSPWQRDDDRTPRNYASMMPMLASISSLRRHNSTLERQSTRASLHRTPSARSEDSTPHSRASSVPNPRDKSDDDDGYDTDLEEDKALAERLVESKDATERQNADIGHHSYEDACRMFGGTVYRKVLDQLWCPALHLNNMGLSTADVKAIATALLRNSRVEEINLAGNGLECKAVAYLCDVMRSNIYITRLNLSGSHIKARGAMAVGNLLQVNIWLSHLYLSDCELDDHTIGYICAGLQDTENLVWLDLSRNKIATDGSMQLGRTLGSNSSLEHINLSWNMIRSSGAVAICKGIQKSPSIREADLSWNGFGFEGCLAVGEMLKTNKKLQKLNLVNNRINWECVPYLVAGFRTNKALKVLEIGQNPLTMDGCYELLDGLSRPHCGVNMVGLQDIPINSKVAFKAAEIAKQRPFTLRHGGIITTRDVFGIQRACKSAPGRRRPQTSSQEDGAGQAGLHQLSQTCQLCKKPYPRDHAGGPAPGDAGAAEA